jgi:hypothetical protein
LLVALTLGSKKGVFVKPRGVGSLSVAFVLAIVAFSSCSDDPSAPSGDTGLSWVAWQDPHIFSYSYALNALWGTSSRDVYAVGDQGVVIRYDGSKWTVLNCGGEKLNAVWSSSPQNVLAVGSAGTVMRYDGRRWATMPTGTAAELLGIWGRAPYDVYVVGEGGMVLHFNGTRWSAVESGVSTVIRDVWGDKSHCFAVGDGGTLLELSPASCRRIDEGTTGNLFAIGGSSATGIHAVGEGGAFLRYDGSSWERVRSGTLRSMTSVCGTQDGHLITVCGSRIGEFDGEEWKFMDVTPTGHNYYSFEDVWGYSMRDLFVLEGDGIQHYDGSTWSVMELPVLPSESGGPSLLDIWGSSANDVYAVGTGGAVLHFDGTSWAATTVGEAGLECVWGISESELYAVSNTNEPQPPPCFDPPCPEGGGIFSSIFASDGTNWRELDVVGNKQVKGLWGVSGDALFAVGSFTEYWEEGGIGGTRDYRAILRYNGSSWSPMIDETIEGMLNDVWGSSENDIFAVGSGGAILHYNGSSWVEMQSGTTEGLLAVWGVSAEDVVAVGGGGVILRFDGVSWSPMEGGSTVALTDVWGSSANDFVAVGGGGSILRYDGSMWTAVPSPAANPLIAVWGAATDDIFAVGEYGTICHYGYR